jgi:hypothetical protein
MKKSKTYIHVNQHVIRANKKHGTNEPVITVKQGKTVVLSKKRTGDESGGRIFKEIDVSQIHKKE